MRVALALAGGLMGCLGWITAAAAQDIQIEDAWARASIGQVANSAAYLRIENSGEKPDRLIAVETTAAERAELHDHLMEDDIARMVEVEAIPVGAGESIALEPHGLHIMLIGLTEPLRAGDSVDLTLHFEEQGAMELDAEVRSLGAREQHHHHHDHRDNSHHHDH